MINKTLFFVCPITEDVTDSRAYKIHMECLRHFADVFEDAVIVLDKTDTYMRSEMLKVQNDFLGLGIDDIQFKVREQDNTFESQHFYNELLMKLRHYDNLVFFTHLKGLTNYGTFDTENIDEWILGMYYQSLNFIDEVEYYLSSRDNAFFGSFLVQTDKPNETYLHYEGCAYWVNPYILRKIGMFEKPCNRWYAEDFPYRNYTEDDTVMPAHNGRYTFNSNMYSDAVLVNKFILGDDYNGFEEYKSNILGKL